MSKLFIVSGYFAFGAHKGHQAMIDKVIEQMSDTDKLCIIVNNDLQAKQKYINGDCPIYLERVSKLADLYPKAKIVKACDLDRTVRETLRQLVMTTSYDEYVFVNSADANFGAEDEVCKYYNIKELYIPLPKEGSSGLEKV